ncbi:MAG: polysulfide reductase NrfD [Chloroflexales bacterium]|nr:polysulfide reductase NrfD [Chloroflexales bacterium]
MDESFVAHPNWEWWIIIYFFLGGIAAGAYAVGTMIDLFGRERDRHISNVAYYIAFPLVAVCGLLLIVDLTRPERFWHMILQNHTFLPMFKYWSPMSVGAWALLLFGGFSFASFLGAFAEDGLFGLGRFRGLALRLHHGPIGVIFEGAGTLVGFFIAAYTGALLTASNVPVWSQSSWIASLFLASAASTGIATMLLILHYFRPTTPHSSIRRLEQTDRYAMILELALLVIFLGSLGAALPLFLGTPYGIMLLAGTLGLGVLFPLFLSFRSQPVTSNQTQVIAVLVLIGGLILRWAIVMGGQALIVTPDIAGR